MKDNNTEYFGPEFLASLASDNTPTGGAPDLEQTFAAPKPPSAEAVAWLRDEADGIRGYVNMFAADILRYVEGR